MELVQVVATHVKSYQDALATLFWTFNNNFNELIVAASAE
jgi:hypothetical protein